jgi:hypothetical protein
MTGFHKELDVLELSHEGYMNGPIAQEMCAAQYWPYSGKEILLYFPPGSHTVHAGVAACLENRRIRIGNQLSSPCILSMLSFYPGPGRTEPCKDDRLVSCCTQFAHGVTCEEKPHLHYAKKAGRCDIS